MTTYQKLTKLSNDSRLTQQISLILTQRFKPDDMAMFNRWLDHAGRCQDAKLDHAKKNGRTL